MKQSRPAVVVTIAILHLIGGGIGLVFGICGGIGLLVQGSLMKSLAVANPQDLSVRLQKHLEQQVPHNIAAQYAGLGIDLVLSVMLLSAGIGLLSMRKWARTLSIVYAPISILVKLFTLGFFLFVTWPVLSAFLDAEAKVTPPGPAATQITIAKVSAFAGVIFNSVLMVYPIVVLFVLLNPSVRAAFTQQSGARRDDEDADDYDDDRPGTRKSRRDDDESDDDRWRAPPSDRYRS
jgi:hypothetical protein